MAIILDSSDSIVDGTQRFESPLRILLFGLLGPTQDIPTLMGAFRRIREQEPDAELVVAGDAHPEYSGYHVAMADRYGIEPGTRFTFDREEDHLDGIWREASILVMPYRRATGARHSLQLATRYGVPVIAFDSDEMRARMSTNDVRAEFVTPGDEMALAERVLALWTDRSRLEDMGRETAAAVPDITVTEAIEDAFKTAAE